MHEVLVKRLGGLSLPRKSVVRLTDHSDMTLHVYRGRKTTTLQLCCNGNRYMTPLVPEHGKLPCCANYSVILQLEILSIKISDFLKKKILFIFYVLFLTI